MVKNENDIEALAKILWDYHLMNHELKKSDLILILGGSHIQVPECGADLFIQGWAPLVMTSGGMGKYAKKLWGKTEAEAFKDVLVSKGVPRNKIILEDKSLNTGENVANTKEILIKKGIFPKTIIAVHKPFMERRSYAAIRKIWPEVEVIVTSPKIPFKEYEIKGRSRVYLVNSLVGYLQRIIEYPKMGFQIEQNIPQDVMGAYEKLTKLGYDKKMIKV